MIVNDVLVVSHPLGEPVVLWYFPRILYHSVLSLSLPYVGVHVYACCVSCMYVLRFCFSARSVLVLCHDAYALEACRVLCVRVCVGVYHYPVVVGDRKAHDKQVRQ